MNGSWHGSESEPVTKHKSSKTFVKSLASNVPNSPRKGHFWKVKMILFGDLKCPFQVISIRLVYRKADLKSTYLHFSENL